MIEGSKFREARKGGLLLRRAPEAHAALQQRVKQRLAGFREWYRPDDPERLADHLSDFLGCLRKAEIKRRERQALSIAGKKPWEFDDLDDQDMVFFGTGYAFQQGVLGAVEEAVWDEGWEFWYSTDAVEGGLLFEAKSVRASPIRKDDERAGLSVEDVLLRDRDAWWRYMLTTMKLRATDRFLLVIWWIIPGEWETLELVATQEEIDKNWAVFSGRVGVLREARKVGELPPLSTRTGAGECERCPFRLVEPCFSELARGSA